MRKPQIEVNKVRVEGPYPPVDKLDFEHYYIRIDVIGRGNMQIWGQLNFRESAWLVEGWFTEANCETTTEWTRCLNSIVGNWIGIGSRK